MSYQKKNFVKFEESDLETFLNLMDVEKQGLITLGDIESACKQLGIVDSYDNIKNLLKDLLDVDEGGLRVDELKKFLLSTQKNEKEQVEEIFEYLDYDKTGTMTKNKLKIQVQDLMNENLTDREVEQMLDLLKNNEGVLDKESFCKITTLKFE